MDAFHAAPRTGFLCFCRQCRSHRPGSRRKEKRLLAHMARSRLKAQDRREREDSGD